MMPINAKYKGKFTGLTLKDNLLIQYVEDMGTLIEGKIEAGQIKKGSNYLMMVCVFPSDVLFQDVGLCCDGTMLIPNLLQPNRDDITISALFGETEEEIPGATCGDQVRIRIRGVEEEDIL